MARQFLRLSAQQLRLIVRDWQLVFWNFWFFLILLALFLGPLSGGDTALRVTLASALVTIGIMANALFSVAVGLTAARERGVFRCYWVTPAPAALPASATVCARAMLVVAAACVQIVVARLAFDVPWSGGVAGWLGLVVFGTAAFTALGFAIAAMAPTPRAANTMANLVFIPMMALGGLSLPASMMPDAWARVYWVLPAATIADGLSGALVGGAGLLGNLGRLGYLAAWTAVAGGFGAYRWIKRGP